MKNIGKLRCAVAALMAIGCMVPAGASAATTALGSNADTYLRDATPRGALTFMDVRGAAIDFRGYLRYDLGALAVDEISSATLTLHVVPGASRNDTPTVDRFSLYGLTDAAGNTPQNWDEATLVPSTAGTEWTNVPPTVTDLDGDVAGMTETITGGGSGTGTFVITGQPLVDFLNARADAGGLATFILANDDATDRGFGIGTKEFADPLLHPTLEITYTAVPEPAALALAGVASLAMLRRRRRD